MSFGFTFVCTWRVDSTLYLFIVFEINFSFHFYFTFMLGLIFRFIFTLHSCWNHPNGHVTTSCTCHPVLFVLSDPCCRFPVPAPLCSVGTREGVTQKNLSGLLPVRDFRLDPSLLYSLPLLALSPNLLIVWVFLSVAYLLAKLRCSWAWDPLFHVSFSLSLTPAISALPFSVFLFLSPLSEELCADCAEFFLVDSALLSNSQSKGLGVRFCLTPLSLSLSQVIMDVKILYNNLT